MFLLSTINLKWQKMGISTFLQELITPQISKQYFLCLRVHETHIFHLGVYAMLCANTPLHTKKLEVHKTSWKSFKQFEMCDAPLTSSLAINCCWNLELVKKNNNAVICWSVTFFLCVWFLENHLYFVQLVHVLILSLILFFVFVFYTG